VNRFTVVYDACVLYPAPLRDLLMRLALTDLFRARLSDQIHEEWINAVLQNRPDLSRAQLERTRSLDQLFPVPRSKRRRHSPVPGATWVACLRTAACTDLHFCPPCSIRSRHACHAGIRLDALLKLLVDPNHGVADLVNLVALPGDRQKHLAAFAPTCPGSNVQRRMTTVIEHRPSTAAPRAH
jgi:hypothetical protein